MIVLRPAKDTCLETARVLLREYAAYLNATVGEEHICMENFEKELSSLPEPYHEPTGIILLAYVDEVPAGIVALKPLLPVRSAALQKAFPDERAGELKRLWVRPEFRGQRLGQLMTLRLLDEARARGYTALYLDTMPTVMPAAGRIYDEMGFQPVEKYTDNAILKSLPGCEDNRAPGVTFYRCSL